MNVKELIDEISIFIDENKDAFEFIVDIYDIENWEIDFNDDSFNIWECCSVFVRVGEDEGLENGFEICKKVKKNGYILYLTA
jgi:hypothetical protein